MIALSPLSSILATPSFTGAGTKLGRLQKVALSLTIIFSFFSNAPARAVEQGKSTQYYRAQALQNIAAGREEEALDSYKAAIKAATAQYGKQSTYLSELYFEMGNLARSNGQSETAKTYYQNAVTYRPNDIPARLQLADLERNTKNIREAFEDSKAAFKLNQNSPIARKGLMLCLQQSGRPAEAAQIANTLHRSGKGSKLPANIPQPESMPTSNAKASAPAADSTTGSTTVHASEGGPIVTAAVSSPSPLHWAPDLKKKIDEAQAKKARDEHAAEAAAKKKKEDEQKADNDKRTKEQHRKEESDKKAKQKSKKDDAAKKASKSKPAFIEPEANTASLKTTAKTIKGDDKSAAKSDKTEKADKTEKTEKTPPKSHLGVGAVTEKTEKPAEEKHESVSENEPAKIRIPAAEKVSIPSYQAPQSIPISIPVVEKKVKGRKSGVLVPPPPPTPVFGGYPPPPGMQLAPAQAPTPPKPRPPKPKPVVKDTAKEAPKDSGDEGSPSPKGASDDPDFLIDWGGGAKKKHGK